MDYKYLGIDIGSTTIKLVVLNKEFIILKSMYRRHYSDIELATKEIISEIKDELKNTKVKVKVTGSGGLGISKWLDVDFVQEVIACTYATKHYIPETDIAIELGGEDAKITYFGESIDQRMNGSCAGGTGAFIDQMATLLNTDAEGVNEYAKSYDKLYPIAARCGVFAKTDIQPLINEGVSKSNISASIYQAVVNQTISGLAAGKPIVGNVAFLGGPLSFSPELRKRFIETLHLSPSEVLVPENAMLFVAIGAAISSEEVESIEFNVLAKRVFETNINVDEETVFLEALFDEKENYETFKKRHEKAKTPKRELSTYKGEAYLGVDAGSTTSKLVVISKEKELLYYDYQNNQGKPLRTIQKMFIKMYNELGDGIAIKYAASTGYGEDLIKSAFKLDLGEIETLCHYKAAYEFNPKVDFILDIGGQDMKCMRVKNGIIYDIMLNEACSSGCGSFIESFARTLNLSLEEFVRGGVESKNPVELGSRCTVFMNSKVKQAQKEGVSIKDISAGLAYSVVKNALVKVIKINDFSKIGDNLVVQGGTFYNDAVLKAFEKTVGKEVIRPDISGLMGAYGAALIAKEAFNGEEKTTFLSQDEVYDLTFKAKAIRCHLCENNCRMTVNIFNDGRKFISGNRCEKGAGVTIKETEIPNMYKYKYERLFDYKSLDREKAPRGEVGIPRVLNIYEHYPFWHTFFTELGFAVTLSPRSNKKIYEMGMDTITSDTICYPAKLVNGHVKSLVDKGVPFIFYPCLPYENKFRKKAEKNYNCPVVISYSEVIANNMEMKSAIYKHPFLPMDDLSVMASNLNSELEEFGVTPVEIKIALQKADLELKKYKNDVAHQGEKILDYMEKNNRKGIVLSGRPYHIDPEINHGLEKIINELGMVVLSEDSVAHLSAQNTKLRVLDQWSFHSRLYSAAEFVSTHKDLELVQLTSFGCGIDAVVAEQVSEILRSNGKSYSLLKIDEGSNLGAIKIRIRSIYSAMKEREKYGHKLPKEVFDYTTPPFTKKMKKTHTILAPQMSPLHFRILEASFREEGYNAVVLPSVDSKAIETGVKYVNNDSCYPAIIVIGQIITALQSGKYDINNTSVFISQTGGGCRASNYITMLRKALHDAGYKIPVISVNLVGLEENPGFKLTTSLIKKSIMGVLYGDILMRLSNKIRPYEVNQGDTNKLVDKWIDILIDKKVPIVYFTYKSLIRKIVKDFSAIEINYNPRPRVAVVGEILIKYHPTGNNDLINVIEREGAEAVVPDLVDFVMYSAYNSVYNYRTLGRSKKPALIGSLLIKFVDIYRRPLNKELEKTKFFIKTSTIREKVKALKGIISEGNQTGEGWFLTAEMMESLSHGVENIISVQPFGCLPNHIFAKSVTKPIKKYYPKANIIAIDYDPGLSSVNQLNRIKLMLEISKNNF